LWRCWRPHSCRIRRTISANSVLLRRCHWLLFTDFSTKNSHSPLSALPRPSTSKRTHITSSIFMSVLIHFSSPLAASRTPLRNLGFRRCVFSNLGGPFWFCDALGGFVMLLEWFFFLVSRLTSAVGVMENMVNQDGGQA
jgi:hypothetical protein